MCTPMPPSAGGSLPTIDPCGKAVELLTQTASRIWAGIAVVLAGSLGLSVWRVWLQPQVGSPSATAQSGRSPTWASNGMSRSGDLAETRFGGHPYTTRRAVNAWTREGLAKESTAKGPKGRPFKVLTLTRKERPPSATWTPGTAWTPDSTSGPPLASSNTPSSRTTRPSTGPAAANANACSSGAHSALQATGALWRRRARLSIIDELTVASAP